MGRSPQRSMGRPPPPRRTRNVLRRSPFSPEGCASGSQPPAPPREPHPQQTEASFPFGCRPPPVDPADN
eukprot:12890029-Prorocentrum_lima.AAC.1